MYNPIFQNYGHIRAIKEFLIEYNSIDIFSMISFTKRCTFNVDPELRKIASNNIIVYDTELSEFINRKINIIKLHKIDQVLGENDILSIFNTLNAANITDLKIRREHVEKSKRNDATSEKKLTNSNKCLVCGEIVSEKVKQYCLSNSKRFNGKVYCFEHQKGI
ncbi:hypothetical protein ACLM5H_19460 [Fredinandcohnia humi]